MPRYRVVHGALKLHGKTYHGDKSMPGCGDEFDAEPAELAGIPAGVVEQLNGEPVGKQRAPGLPKNEPHRKGTLLKRERADIPTSS